MQGDFEVIASVHNGKERLLYFINTRSLGLIQGCKERSYLKSERLLFKFVGLHEPLDGDKLFLQLDNDMGISEKIEGLCFCEVLIKDHERSLLVDSGVRFIDSGESVFKKYYNLEYNPDNADFYEIHAVEDTYEYRMLIVKEKGYEDKPRIFLSEIEISLDKSFVINKN